MTWSAFREHGQTSKLFPYASTPRNITHILFQAQSVTVDMERPTLQLSN